MNKRQMRLCVIGSLTICMILRICGIHASAGQNMEDVLYAADTVSGNDSGYISVSAGDTVSGNGVGGAVSADPEGAESVNADTADSGTVDTALEDTEPVSVIYLQAPDNLDFVIDPWNLSGRGQIYSERFMIRNCGNTACVIQLRDIACQGSDGVVIVGDAGQIYGQHTANVYLEMVFENGETIVLSGEGREHTATLEPGDELIFWFAGAVNEKATEGWENEKISVKLKYFPTVG